MTSGCIQSFPAASSERSFYLLEEVLLGNAQTQERKPQHCVTSEGHVVLPQRIVDNVPRMQMVDTVDLENDTEVLPTGVEKIASRPPLSHYLSIRFG